MLNKEITLLEKEDPIVIMTVGAKETSFKAMTYGYLPEKDVGRLNKVPYWGSPSCFLKELYETYSGMYDSYNTWIITSENPPFDISASVEGKTIYLSSSVDSNVRFEWIFNFSSMAGQQKIVTFDPPPPTDTSKTYFKSSMEESVDVKQGIIDGECKKSRDSTSNKWWQRCTCNGKVQRRDRERISGQHEHCKRQGSVCERFVSMEAFKYAQRKGSMVHHRHLSGRIVCVCIWWSKLTSKEALYA